MPPSPARNAIDCALWDLEAKTAGLPVWQLANVPKAEPRDDGVHGESRHGRRDGRASELWPAPRFAQDQARLGGMRKPTLRGSKRSGPVLPRARLIVDANEGWSIDALARFVPSARAAGVELIEQPLPADADHQLAGFASTIPIAADESLVEGADLGVLAARYQAVNIKLDKTGGLTRALALVAEVRALGLDVMVGCMVATSLAMAPALLLADFARFVDLDGPLLLARDRQPGLAYNGDSVEFSTDVWG